MTTFLNTNPGLPSRFPNSFNFADYTHDEMAQILRHVVVSNPNPNPSPNPNPNPNPNRNPNPNPNPNLNP